ncbi:MAG: D-alanyl-D-alanine carboxypeptidase/D-alanyl-D-alanine-endopeptidase, partial [Planctomycetes bacterium]|nr:D-alanyl-D-alanine carboxypeptidase/D-alanyl-D-alanine-endopeptidase [Planctomycetota bacterium]
MSRGSARTPRRAVLAAVLLAAACVSPKAHVRRALDELVRSEALAGGRIGVVVADIASGEVLAEHDGHRGFATASNMKLLSSAVALQTLGPDYTTSTELLMVGEVEGGTLHGDLLLRGHGDPTFGDAGVDAFVAAVRAAGIERVDGSIRGDGSWLGREQRGEGWQWDYLDAGYAAPFGGLCVDQSCVEVRVRPAGGAVAVECRPSTGRAPVVGVELLPAGAASRITAERAPGSDRIAVHGTIAADSAPVAVRVAVADSARFAAEVFAERLRGAGVAVGSAPAVAALGPERLLAQHDSPPLAAIVRPLLTDSNNLYAEQVWRLAARQACGSGDTAAAAWHATELFEALDIDTRGMVLADGSGLS